MRFTVVLLFTCCLSLNSISLANDVKSEVAIYATGGTIASSASSTTQTTDYEVGLSVQSLLDAVPELNKIAKISANQISNVASSDIGEVELLRLARSIKAKLVQPNISGVVITHGTDTTEETAFFLDLTTRSHKPIVVVGAMRPASAVSADGPMNLLEAVTLASNPDAQNRGVMIVLNDRIGSAFYTTKTNATTIDTFKAVEQGYLGTFIGLKPRFYYEATKPTNKPFFDISQVNRLAKVAIIYSHQDQDIRLIDAAIENGAKGIVIAANGNGSLSKELKAKTIELMNNHIPVVRSTRTGSRYVSAKEEGIGSGYYNPQKARILLSLALSQNQSMQEIREYFE